MTGWRPKEGWKNPHKDVIKNHPEQVSDFGQVEMWGAIFETSADTMHGADVEWMRCRLKAAVDGSIIIFCTQTDWEHFSGGVK